MHVQDLMFGMLLTQQLTTAAPHLLLQKISKTKVTNRLNFWKFKALSFCATDTTF